ncbi:uncharacterized protein LOC143073426 isoform X2 [Mytilus galloprovincialis]|uniref:uncharacterized protein LOC143073426 isoform X2 n=1 Tax=Mytilus galloprovincialis TaxID=29158 RepID=UPI003F7BC3CD
MSDTYAKIPQPFQNIGPKVYMILSRGCIYYFRNEYCKTASGKFSLFGFNTVARATEVSDGEAMYAFKINHTHPEEFKSYLFACSSEKEMKEWMKCIKEELKIANDSGKRDGDYYYTDGFMHKQTPEAQGSSADSGFGPSADGDTTSISYKDIEESIYDDPTSFQPPSDYGLYAKKADEASDDEDIPNEPPPVPPRLANADPNPKTKRKKKRKKKKEKMDELDQLPDISKVAVSRTESAAKLQADAISAEMKNMFGKEKQKSTESEPSSTTSRNKKQPSLEPPEVEDVDEEEEEEDDGDKYWQSIHFEGEKEKASEIIRDIGENGVFLVRNGDDGGKVLVVFADNMPKKYKINCKDNEYFIATAGPHAETLEEMLFEYFMTDLPNTTVKLTTPFQLHPSQQ